MFNVALSALPVLAYGIWEQEPSPISPPSQDPRHLAVPHGITLTSPRYYCCGLSCTRLVRCSPRVAAPSLSVLILVTEWLLHPPPSSVHFPTVSSNFISADYAHIITKSAALSQLQTQPCILPSIHGAPIVPIPGCQPEDLHGQPQTIQSWKVWLSLTLLLSPS